MKDRVLPIFFRSHYLYKIHLQMTVITDDKNIIYGSAPFLEKKRM